MKTLIKFKQFVDEINKENGRNYKLSILEKYKDDEDIKYYLKFTFDPYVVTGISDKKLARFHRDSCIDIYPDVNTFKTTKEALEYLKEHNTGTYDTLDLMFSYYMQLYIFDCKPLFDVVPATNLHDLFEKIISKNLILGIDAKSINKIIPNLVPTFNVMLANKYFDKPEAVEEKEFAITTKIDGCRIIALKENGKVSFWTRQGQQYEGLVDLETELINNFPDNICLDGELTLLDKGNLNSGDQYKATTKLCRRDGEKHNLKMLVFDAMSASDFRSQYNNVSYNIRRQVLEDIFTSETVIQEIDFQTMEGKLSEIKKDFKFFELLPVLYRGTDTSKIIEFLEEQTSKGEEGIMLNILDAPYEFKRTFNLLKVKKMQTLDLEVVGFEEGTNSNKGKLGALLVRYKDGNIVKVGSGFTNSEIYDKDGNLIHQDDRKEIWAHQKDWLGRIVEVQYFEETYDSNTGLPSLRFPVYIDYREDKLEPDF